MEASRVARPGVIVAAGWVALLLYAYPGRLTAEAFELLRQARTKFFEPANPPGLAGLWRWLEMLVAGPFALWLVQSITFTAGAWLLVRRVRPDTRGAWLTAAVLCVPPVTAGLGALSSASVMSGLLVVGAAALLHTSRRVQVAGLVALFLATCAQPRALVATLPLVVLLFRWRPEVTTQRRAAHAVLAWVVISVAALGVTKHYTKQPTPIASYVEPTTNVRWQEVPRGELPPDALRWGIPTRTTVLQDAWTDAYASVAQHTPLFSPWLFVVLGVLLVPLAMRDPAALALVISGVSFQLAYRMSVWPIAASCLAGALVLAARKVRT